MQPVTPFWRETGSEAVPPVGLGAIMRFVRALLAAAWRYRRSSLAQLIAAAGRPLTRRAPSNLAVATAQFDRLCLWLPLRDRCLFKSFFQLEFYRAYGVSADWVFGVSLFPFHAHCWIADGDLLLGERLGKVEGFSVILRVEGGPP
ncbi:lasso peptide biosynthesis B2 protein [Sphingomonas sp. GlSt437]|uniref:lasso peptide biosynthesis B2 protein n=1 Tax=Sphingomonas sp. GlSt437 TaxID=3389970 RepID=UPI003A88EAC3